VLRAHRALSASLSVALLDLPLCCFIALLNQRGYLAAITPTLVPTSPKTSLKEGKLYHRLKGPLRGLSAYACKGRI
jgi:hypothetical protein